ncbi:hypothetical protein Angca_006573 [Angiostrongylus cantonensis]|nr:hypothetical protein Angca_006573 [Angiostrongylus cantonensis]
MFRKPFSVKKNTSLRNSDAKKLLQRLPEEGVAVLPKKVLIAHVKLLAFNGAVINVYVVDREPMFFDFDDSGFLFPTLYFSWIGPTTFPTLVVHESVLRYLENGADLMLQGVIREGIPLSDFPRGSPVTISVLKDGHVMGPMVVGIALMSSEEMIANKFEGKGVQVLHIFKDTLWEFGSRVFPPLHSLDCLSKNTDKTEAFVEEKFPSIDVGEHHSSCESKSLDNNSSIVTTSSEESMDELLLRCFLAAVKFRLEKLPMDVGQFYSTCLLKCVPSGRRLDMKKTKYKKFSAFLNEVTDAVLPILRCCGNYTKGQLLAVPEIRQIVTDYVKREELNQDKTVRLDPILADVTRIAGEVTDWNTLNQKIQSKMTKTFVLRMPDGRELVRKINMPKIIFKVETRSGNKKVTLINNLEVFGIDTKKLCQQIQVEAATSATTTNEASNCEGPQITVLGNQVNYLGDLLQNEYGIEKKYIAGLELGIKKKQK